MSLGDHLEELRKRLVVGLLGLAPIVVLALVFGQDLLAIMIRPVQEALRDAGLSATLQATSPLETFGAYIRVSLIAAVLAGAPWLIWNLWRFTAPGLYARERRFVYVLVPLSTLLTCTGVLFLYYVILPVVLTFFIGFGSGVARHDAATSALPAGVVLPQVPVLEGDPPEPSVGEAWVNSSLRQWRVCVGEEGGRPVVLASDLTRGTGIAQQYRVSEYVKMMLNLALAFSVGFQLPVVQLLLGWTGLVEREWLARFRRQAVVVCLVGSALLTPADPISMVLLAGPLYGLYELGMLLMRVLPASRVSDGFGEVRPASGAVGRGADGDWHGVPERGEGPDAGDE